MNINEFLLEIHLGKKKLSIKARDEQHSTLFRQAELRINQKMEHYQKKYNLNDEATFYLMICLDLATDLIQLENELQQGTLRLKNLSTDLEQALTLNLLHENLTNDSSTDVQSLNE